jgi:multiple sugar transport system substrate-binding protein
MRKDMALAACIVAFACGSDEPTAKKSEPVELSYMAWWNVPSEAATTQGSLDAFNGSTHDIHLNLIAEDRKEYETKMNERSAANNLPDTAMMAETQVIKWAIEGQLADMSDLYEKDDEPLPQLAFTYLGRPVGYSIANEVIIIVYSRKAFDDAGLPYPPAKAEDAWTWDEFVAVAKKLTKDNSGLSPDDSGFDADSIVAWGGDFHRGDWIWPVLAVSNGGGVVSEDGKELLLEKKETIEAAQAIADLQLVHHTTRSFADWQDDMQTIEESLVSGRYAMIVTGQWELGVTLKKAVDEHPNFYGVGVLPKMKTAVTYNTGGVNIVFNSSRHPEQAKEFLRWYTLEENNIENITSGLWMPTKRKWYTDATLIDQWVNNKYHPPVEEYKSAVIDYALNNAKQVPWYYFSGYDKINEILGGPDMMQVWDGAKTAEDAFTADILPKVRPIFEANKH